MRLSYLRYMLKTTDPRKLFEQESEELDLSPQFRSLLVAPKTASRFSTEPLPA
jgi:hypothetical protein